MGDISRRCSVGFGSGFEELVFRVGVSLVKKEVLVLLLDEGG